MKKGDLVKIKARVVAITHYAKPNPIREIKRLKPTSEIGIVLGYSFLKAGTITDTANRGYQLKIEKSHKILVIEPLESWKSWAVGGTTQTNRYLEPIRCFEKDLELLIEANYV